MANLPLLWIIPALPLGAAAINLLLGDRLGKRGTAWLACGAIGLAFLAALRAVLTLAGRPELDRVITETAYTWMRVGDFSANVAFLREKLYVAYALQDADGEDEVAGPGLGYVDVYSLNGKLVRRLVSGDLVPISDS